MKHLNYALVLLLLLNTSVFAQDIMPDIIAETIHQEERLSALELKAEKKTFLEFITKYRNSEFVGHTQYTLSALNLSIRANAKYSIETDGTVLFQLATDGNHYIHVSDVTFPMQGSVYFEVKDNQGLPLEFATEEGDTVSFHGKRNKFYIVESEKSFNLRKNIQSKFNRADKPMGRFMAIVRFDLFTQDIEFFEIHNSKLLLRRGSFNGNAAPSRRGW
jgi:hypothetical protein